LNNRSGYSTTGIAVIDENYRKKLIDFVTRAEWFAGMTVDNGPFGQFWDGDCVLDCVAETASVELEWASW